MSEQDRETAANVERPPKREERVTRQLDQALKLPPDARAALAGSLLASLDGAADEAAEDGWHAEIQCRLHELDSGQLQATPWPEARRQILVD